MRPAWGDSSCVAVVGRGHFVNLQQRLARRRIVAGAVARFQVRHRDAEPLRQLPHRVLEPELLLELHELEDVPAHAAAEAVEEAAVPIDVERR